MAKTRSAWMLRDGVLFWTDGSGRGFAVRCMPYVADVLSVYNASPPRDLRRICSVRVWLSSVVFSAPCGVVLLLRFLRDV